MRGRSCIAIGGFRHRRLFDRTAKAVVLVMALGALGHLFVGAEYPRPILFPPYPDLSYAFMAWVQHVDPPGNVFPSLHVAHTTMLSLLLLRDRPRLGRLALLMATMLALSTLTTKQHFIADVLGGYALAALGRAFALSRPAVRWCRLLGGGAFARVDRVLEVDPLELNAALRQLRLDGVGLADDDDQERVGVQEVLGRRLGLRLVDGGQPQRQIAHVADPQAVLLGAHQRARDPRRRLQAERIAAGVVPLGLVQLAAVGPSVCMRRISFTEASSASHTVSFLVAALTRKAPSYSDAPNDEPMP